MITVGLTGGIASGKSTVAGFFRDLGAPLIDSDSIAHQSLSSSGAAFHAVVDAFGETILTDAGEIDRALLGRMVFSDGAQRELLNSIVHPVVEQRIAGLLDSYRQSAARAVIVDVPLLFEVGWESRFDLVALVFVSDAIQLERLVRRSGWPMEEARRRIEAQWPLHRKMEKADFIIDNSGTPGNTRVQVEAIWARIQQMAGSIPPRE